MTHSNNLFITSLLLLLALIFVTITQCQEVQVSSFPTTSNVIESSHFPIVVESQIIQESIDIEHSIPLTSPSLPIPSESVDSSKSNILSDSSYSSSPTPSGEVSHSSVVDSSFPQISLSLSTSPQQSSDVDPSSSFASGSIEATHSIVSESSSTDPVVSHSTPIPTPTPTPHVVSSSSPVLPEVTVYPSVIVTASSSNYKEESFVDWMKRHKKDIILVSAAAGVVLLGIVIIAASMVIYLMVLRYQTRNRFARRNSDLYDHLLDDNL